MISAEQALSHMQLEMEIGKVTFDDIKVESRAVWNKYLSRIDVVDPGVGTVSRGKSDITKVEIVWRSVILCNASAVCVCACVSTGDSHYG